MWYAIQRLRDFLGFALEIIWISAVPSLFVGLYSCLVVYVMVLAAVLGWELFVWLVPVVMLSPVVVVWFRVLRKRYREYVAMMMGSTSFKWDIDAAVKGWVEITRAKKKIEKRG